MNNDSRDAMTAALHELYHREASRVGFPDETVGGVCPDGCLFEDWMLAVMGRPHSVEPKLITWLQKSTQTVTVSTDVREMGWKIGISNPVGGGSTVATSLSRDLAELVAEALWRLAQQ